MNVAIKLYLLICCCVPYCSVPIVRWISYVSHCIPHIVFRVMLNLSIIPLHYMYRYSLTWPDRFFLFFFVVAEEKNGKKRSGHARLLQIVVLSFLIPNGLLTTAWTGTGTVCMLQWRFYQLRFAITKQEDTAHLLQEESYKVVKKQTIAIA